MGYHALVHTRVGDIKNLFTWIMYVLAFGVALFQTRNDKKAWHVSTNHGQSIVIEVCVTEEPIVTYSSVCVGGADCNVLKCV